MNELWKCIQSERNKLTRRYYEKCKDTQEMLETYNHTWFFIRSPWYIMNISEGEFVMKLHDEYRKKNNTQHNIWRSKSFACRKINHFDT